MQLNLSVSEHNLKIKHLPNHRHTLAFVLLYCLLLNILIEQSVNTNLVMLQNPEYIDTVDTIVEKKNLMVHFMKAHHTFTYFKQHNGNKQLKEIYERTVNVCDHCLHDQAEYTELASHQKLDDLLVKAKDNIAIGEEISALLFRQGICSINHESIVKKFGIIRISDALVKQLLGFPLNKHLPKKFIKSLNNRIRKYVESGIAVFTQKNELSTNFNILPNSNPTYKICKSRNKISSISHSKEGQSGDKFVAIKIKNLYFLVYLARFFFALFFIWLLHLMFCFWFLPF